VLLYIFCKILLQHLYDKKNARPPLIFSAFLVFAFSKKQKDKKRLSRRAFLAASMIRLACLTILTLKPINPSFLYAVRVKHCKRSIYSVVVKLNHQKLYQVQVYNGKGVYY
jgi:hypothetical protein